VSKGPNPSFERTALSRLRRLKADAQLERYAPALHRAGSPLCSNAVAKSHARAALVPGRGQTAARAKHRSLAASGSALQPGARRWRPVVLQRSAHQPPLRGRLCCSRAGSRSRCVVCLPRSRLRRWAAHNRSIERTAPSSLRELASAAHVERYAPRTPR